jgi:hypothetical protein
LSKRYIAPIAVLKEEVLDLDVDLYMLCLVSINLAKIAEQQAQEMGRKLKFTRKYSITFNFWLTQRAI